VIPRSITSYLGIYSAWLSRRGENGRGGDQVRRLLRRWTLQIALHVILVTGLFLVAAAAARRLQGTFPSLPAWLREAGGTNAIVWMATMLLAMPLLIVSVRKLRAIAAVLAERSVATAAAGEQTRAIRGVVSGTIRIAGGTAMILWLLLLSAAILPPWPILLVLLVALIAVAIFRWRYFEKVYARAQLSLRDTLARPPEIPPPPPRAMPTVLQGADLETVHIDATSPASGKLIRELELRRRTGASAVGIERNGNSIVNPGPDEEIHPGDKVLLLGSRQQLDSALALLGKQPA
jgi:CPA2 family monovalent cation:H+ antiporter-2